VTTPAVKAFVGTLPACIEILDQIGWEWRGDQNAYPLVVDADTQTAVNAISKSVRGTIVDDQRSVADGFEDAERMLAHDRSALESFEAADTRNSCKLGHFFPLRAITGHHGGKRTSCSGFTGPSDGSCCRLRELWLPRARACHSQRRSSRPSPSESAFIAFDGSAAPVIAASTCERARSPLAS
jgi:hypothetical protein